MPCNKCGRCCEQFSYSIQETDLINWFYDVEQDNTFILERVAVAWVDLEDSGQIHYSTALEYCEMKFELGKPLSCVSISMRKYSYMESAFDVLGECWFYDSKNKICKIHNVKPESCRSFYCKDGKGNNGNVFEDAIIKDVPYPHKLSEKIRIAYYRIGL